MTNEIVPSHREAVVAAMARALTEAFGARACSVAKHQADAAAGESRDAWVTILDALHADQARPQ